MLIDVQHFGIFSEFICAHCICNYQTIQYLLASTLTFEYFFLLSKIIVCIIQQKVNNLLNVNSTNQTILAERLMKRYKASRN